MQRLVFLFSFFLTLFQLQAQDISPLERMLFDLPDVQFTKVETLKGFEASYQLRIKQAIDHKDPSKGHFYQRVWLNHRGFDRPTVMVTQGYHSRRNGEDEPTALLEANELDMEHRYFGASTPDSVDYRYLNLEQATADYHHINQLFRTIYSGKWLSTGISKGGQTTIFYRYFYPNDVDVSIPYVAPMNLDREEKRIYTFLDTVGTPECRKALEAVQFSILKQRDAVLPRIYWYGKGAGLEFTYLDFEKAFEYTVLEYPFSFWQWGSKCEDIPLATAPIDTLVDHLLKVSNIDFFSDKLMENYATHYYQAGSEMGYYSYETKKFKGLLKALPTNSNPSAIFMPKGSETEFNDKVINDCSNWVTKNGDKFIYINGNSDTWSATAVRPNKKNDALWFFMPNTDHGKARIKNLSADDKAKMVSALERWLDLEISDTGN